MTCPAEHQEEGQKQVTREGTNPTKRYKVQVVAKPIPTPRQAE